MTDEDVVRRFHEIIGLGHFSGPNKRGKGKDLYLWRVSNFEHCQMVIILLWPWLHERRKQRASEVLRIARERML